MESESKGEKTVSKQGYRIKIKVPELRDFSYVENLKGRHHPMVLKRMLALTMAMARMDEISISMGAWCGL